MAGLFKNTEINREQGRGMVKVLGKGISAAGDMLKIAGSVMETGTFKVGSENAMAAGARLNDGLSAVFSAQNVVSNKI